MSPMSVDDAHERIAAILDEIETIGIHAETDGRDLSKEEVERVAVLSKQFDECEKIIELHADE